MKIQQDTRSVYIIKNDELKRIKVGFSNNPMRRLNDIMMQSGCRMTLVYHTKPITNYAEVEKNMHSLFSDKRIMGEWFGINPKTAIARLKGMVQESDICPIIKNFEKGRNATYIAGQLGVSRSGVVKYLKANGYMLKAYEEKKKVMKKTEKDVKPVVALSSERISEMVKRSKEKALKKQNKNG